MQELNPANLYTLDVEQFKAHMKYLHDNGFQTITTEQLSDLLYRKKKLPPKSVMITFDDGIATNLEYAYPVLKEYGFHAVEYVITSYVKQEAEPFAPGQRQFMNLPRMKECGDVFEYQSHTDNMHYYHTPGSPILLNAAEDEIRMDLRKSFDLPQMKKTSFAFPYGRYDKRLLRLLRELKVEQGMTTKRCYVTQDSDPMELGRFMFRSTNSFEEFKEFVNGRYVPKK